MPHRLLAPAFTNLVEGLVLTFLAAFNGGVAALEMISDGDWTRINGPNGVACIAVVAVIVLWSRSVVKERNEDKRRTREEIAREARNAELLTALKDADESNKCLTKQCIEVIERQTSATVAFDKTIQHHTNFICGKIEGIRKKTAQHHE